MKLEILQEVPRVAGRHFVTKTLTTDLRWDGLGTLPITAFDTFRMSHRTNVWRGPKGEQFTYEDLRAHHASADFKFPGTSYFREAVDIEYWEDEASDGHIEWMYQATYRMFLQTELDESSSLWLRKTSGDDIQRLLSEYVYDMNRTKRQKEHDAK